MENKLLDGKLISENIYVDLEKKVKDLNIVGKLQILMVGNNPSSEIYVRQKLKACERIGLKAKLDHLKNANDVTTASLIALIEKYNDDPEITGIIVQLPLPEQIDKTKLIKAIDPMKDVDGLTPYNMGLTMLGEEFEYLTPCTATGVVKMLEYYKIKIDGKKIAVIGQGKIAGKPIAIMLLNRGATVTSCNSKTPDISEFTKNADIVVVAAGKPNLITKEIVKKDAIIIDVGITKLENGKISGDSDFNQLLSKVAMISPVPGGVGKMTVVCLMQNLVKASMKS
ncbi:bifunctional 5,10-methylene-tetrahydrofolate dehydrogenase/5,10-methylene-tetrahydrofolate cyclohydrolase [Candidatus Peregrinibacteria bacterium]|nr:bifunctional 5,10-methylene-tetrahydrofolate dehydrogenase/5,10-methylene-tetrahydrofolate cyclohydrolase [Candidatus Peregrinibacteria bacterium]